jgi:hypothetical protein
VFPGGSRVSRIGVGGLYEPTSSQTPSPDDPVGSLPVRDPVGDVFRTSIYGPVPDIVSVSADFVNGGTVVTIKLQSPVAGAASLGPLIALVLVKTPAPGRVQDQWSYLFPLADVNLEFTAAIDARAGTLTRLDTSQRTPISAGAVGDTISFTVPDSVLALSGATLLVLVGAGEMITDVAPNGGPVPIGN